MTTMKIAQDELEDFVPHSGKLMLLSGIISWADTFDSLICAAIVDRSNVFYDPDLKGIPSIVAFEYMAQSIAALSGLERHLNGDSKPRIGLVMSVRHFLATCETLPMGELLKINIRENFKDRSVVSFECSMESDVEILASGTINAYEPERQ